MRCIWVVTTLGQAPASPGRESTSQERSSRYCTVYTKFFACQLLFKEEATMTVIMDYSSFASVTLSQRGAWGYLRHVCYTITHSNLFAISVPEPGEWISSSTYRTFCGFCHSRVLARYQAAPSLNHPSNPQSLYVRRKWDVLLRAAKWTLRASWRLWQCEMLARTCCNSHRIMHPDALLEYNLDSQIVRMFYSLCRTTITPIRPRSTVFNHGCSDSSIVT